MAYKLTVSDNNRMGMFIVDVTNLLNCDRDRQLCLGGALVVDRSLALDDIFEPVDVVSN